MKHTDERIEELFQGLLGMAERSEERIGRVIIGRAAALPEEDPELILALIERTELQTRKALDDRQAGRIPEALLAHRAQLLAGVDAYLIARLKHYTEAEPERLLIDWQALDRQQLPEDLDRPFEGDFPVDFYAKHAGKDFGRLHVLGGIGQDEHGTRIYLCRCSCGRWKLARGSDLVRGDVRSCGCLRLQHGGTGSRLFRIWESVKTRCTNEHDPAFQNYGGRGIRICDEWRDSFEAFRTWAEANGYADDLTIDRIDVDGDYAPENCRWATRKEQQNNTRRNVLVTYRGQLLTLMQASEASGISYSVLRHRKDRHPEYTEAELFAPVGPYRRRPRKR